MNELFNTCVCVFKLRNYFVAIVRMCTLSYHHQIGSTDQETMVCAVCLNIFLNSHKVDFFKPLPIRWRHLQGIRMNELFNTCVCVFKLRNYFVAIVKMCTLSYHHQIGSTEHETMVCAVCLNIFLNSHKVDFFKPLPIRWRHLQGVHGTF